MSADPHSTSPLAIATSTIAEAEKLAGLTFTETERALMLEDVNKRLPHYEQLRAFALENHVPPALTFDPRPAPLVAVHPRRASRHHAGARPVPPLPADLESLAFYPVTDLAALIRVRQVTSLELTEMYLERLKHFDPSLHCVVTLCEELALAQARRADEELAAGNYRGPLHGIPWGAKDLLATRGVPTTWGATPYKDQVFDEDATVVQRLAEAGAVLVAKLSLGALAWGDVWFGGQTRNPWELAEGSSGSSAGSAAATAAGLVGFAIGTETWGSIVSPATVCGVTGLRPTFGRVSRHGAMALCWSLDKIGPLARSVEDCALIFDALYGPDGHDRSVVDQPFDWDPGRDVTALRVGYVESAFASERPDKAQGERTLEVLRELGCTLIPIELPGTPESVEPLALILEVEAAAAFDELTRSDRDDLLERQVRDAWPDVFRHARLIPAVEYVQANRIRMRLMEGMAELMARIDVYVVPSHGGTNLLLTNLTGHPAVVLPNGWSEKDTPVSITFTGQLYGEAGLLAVARAYQEATTFHLRHPELAR